MTHAAQAGGFYIELLDEQGGGYLETVTSEGKVYAVGRPGQSFTVECGLADGSSGGPWVVQVSVSGRDALVSAVLRAPGSTWVCEGFLSNWTGAEGAGGRQFTYKSFELSSPAEGQEARSDDAEGGASDLAGLVEVRFYEAETFPCPRLRGKYCPDCASTGCAETKAAAVRRANGGEEKKFFQKPSLGVKGGVSKKVQVHGATSHFRTAGEPVVLRIQCETRSCLELRGILERPPAPPRSTGGGNAGGTKAKAAPVIYILD